MYFHTTFPPLFLCTFALYNTIGQYIRKIQTHIYEKTENSYQNSNYLSQFTLSICYFFKMNNI